MDRAGLEQRDRAALIEIILRQQETIARLMAEVAELKAEACQPPKTTGNSSVPPSVGFKPNRTERRVRKRRRGHDGISQRRQPPDVIVRCRPSTCSGCGEPLPEVGHRRVGRSQVVELPPLQPVVIEAWQYAARCRRCGTRTKGRYPEGLEPTRTFGPGVDTLLGYFHERHHVSYERLVELRHLFGRAIHLGQLRATITPISFARRRLRIENAVDRLVFRTFLPHAETANARRLQERYHEHRASLFVFLDRPDVPPTNNASEQDLRPSVIHRKVTGGYRSQHGADVSAVLTSLLTTARKRGQNLLDALRSVAGPSPIAAVGLA